MEFNSMGLDLDPEKPDNFPYTYDMIQGCRLHGVLSVWTMSLMTGSNMRKRLTIPDSWAGLAHDFKDYHKKKEIVSGATKSNIL